MPTHSIPPAGANSRQEPLPPTARASVRGRVVSGPSLRAAFTLAEILIAITLIVIVGGLAVANFDALANGIRKQTPEQVLKDAIRETRYAAVLNKRSMLLGYDNTTSSFVTTDYISGNQVASFPLDLPGKLNKVEIKFDPILPLKDMTSSVTDTPPEFANVTLTQLMFHSSGASTPVKIEMTINDHDTTMILDPFSEGPPPKPPID
jgi:Tfp pilus assembly protein FimT